jgi:hypothetical protein
VKESVREIPLTLPTKFPRWELESQWTPKSSESNFKGQNPMDWGILFISLENFLERRCLKWAHIIHLDIWNTSYDQKKGRKSNYQFDSRPLKVKNCPNFLTFRWCATYNWKSLDEGYNFASYLISIGGLHAKLWGPKVARVPTMRISGLPLGSPETKWHLGVGPMARHKVYYKGEGGGFPQIRDVVSLVSPSLPVAHPSTKSALIMQ